MVECLDDMTREEQGKYWEESRREDNCLSWFAGVIITIGLAAGGIDLYRTIHTSTEGSMTAEAVHEELGQRIGRARGYIAAEQHPTLGDRIGVARGYIK